MSNLSHDILLCIISFVPASSTLGSIARCSSVFYSLTVPVLYKHVDLYSLRCGRFPHLRTLTILLITKPSIAQHVRQFTLRDLVSKVPPNSNTERSKLDLEDVLKEAIIASSHSTEESEEWIIDLAADRLDAILAILLPTMVKLEKLDLMLRGNYTYFDRMISRAVAREKPFDTQTLFEKLTSFMHAASWVSDYGESLMHHLMSSEYALLFQSFLQVQSIFGHTISDSGVADRATINIYPSFKGTSSSLTHHSKTA